MIYQDTFKLQTREAAIQQNLPLRVALYSSGVVGLGHMRRSLLVAQALSHSPLHPALLMLADARQAGAFHMPKGMDCVTLPALMKTDGQFQSRYLSLPVHNVSSLRGAMLLSILEEYRPHLLLVDNVPRGVMGELAPVLRMLQRSDKTRIALGMRDVLDDPEAVKSEWEHLHNQDFILQNYDEVWVYGDPAVNDVVQEYGFQKALAQRIRYTGYLDQSERIQSSPREIQEVLESLELTPHKYALCLVGGGQDGARLARTFALTDMPTGMKGLIIAGPFMPESEKIALHHAVMGNRNVKVLEFFPEPALLIKYAASVVSMGGYNTTMEILSFGARALLVPRVKPRSEQLIRAERLQKLGLIDVMHPDRLDSCALERWLNNTGSRPVPASSILDMQGMKRIPAYMSTLLARQISCHIA